jgi:hypothetical protein
MLRTLLLAIPLLVTACQADAPKADGKPAAKSGKTEAAAPPVDDGPWAAWDMAGRKAAFAGAHLTPGWGLGSWDAWDVKGDTVKVWNGTAEKTLELRVASPCEAELIEKSDGGSSSTTSHYTVKGGQLITGLGDAGSRKGPEAVACVSNSVFTLDAGGKCLEWNESMFKKGTWESKPGTCGWVKDGDKELFAVTVNGSETRLLVDGDALMSEQLKTTHSEKQLDYAAARTARDAKAGKVAGG